MSHRNVNHSQRVAVVAALAAALFVVGQWATSWRRPRFTGWTGYAPLESGASHFPGTIHPWVPVLIWLVLIATWTIVTLIVLRDRSSPTTTAATE